MNILVDTQILIWSLDVHSQLTHHQREVLLNTDNRILLSYISLMEVVIKKAVGKLPDFVPPIDQVAALWQ